ncbi:hypothetical protein [Sandarakinorhabdus sp.]|uniref:hypothetical protein n=1 Tax=Sandarakinorhabdus sp. TaxID=1916663 RepID=UPI003F716B3D
MPLGRESAQDNVDRWIKKHVPGLSFVDIGGIGEWSTNERMTWAQKHGASRVAVADIADYDSSLWNFYHNKISELGITGIEEMQNIDVNDANSMSALGKFDFVHCTGVIYHCPTPVQAMINLANATKKYLIVNTVIIPDLIENEVGRLAFPNCSAAFLPGLNGHEREIFRVYYRNLKLDVDRFAPPLNRQAEADLPFLRDGKATWLPYWFLFTESAFEGLVRMLGMEVIEREIWRNHTLKFLLHKK